MTALEVNYCALAEVVRDESAGSLTLIGFHGITPKVQVEVAQLEAKTPFAVVVELTPEDRQRRLKGTVKIEGPQGKLIGPLPLDAEIPTGVTLRIILTRYDNTFSSEGNYLVTIANEDGSLVYETSFQVIVVGD